MHGISNYKGYRIFYYRTYYLLIAFSENKTAVLHYNYDIYVAIIISRPSPPRRDALFRLARLNSVIESDDTSGSARMWIAAWLVAAVARRGAASEVPLLENVERSAVAAVLRGGFSLPLPRLLHRTARRGFSLVVGERERGSAGARGRCPSRRPTLSKPTRSSTHTPAVLHLLSARRR